MAKKNTHSKGGKPTKSRKMKDLRGEVMGVFRSEPARVYNYKQVAARIGVRQSQERSAVAAILQELRDLELLKSPATGKYQLHPNQQAALYGTIDFTRSGSAFVVTEGSGQDVYIKEGDTGCALHGDEVELAITGQRRGRMEGKVSAIRSRAATEFVGVLQLSDKHAFLLASNPRIHVDFYLDRKRLKDAQNGQKVVVRLMEWKDPKKSPYAEVVRVLGEPGVHEVEMHAILLEFGLPVEFPEQVLREADALDKHISEAEIKRRRDFRGVPTFTIDPEDAKDFDDALSLRELGKDRYEVGVHIADVSHYVRPGTALEEEAYKRATSVYLVDRVVPMLPEVLSNEVCSLRPDETKLCMSAVFEVDGRGRVKKEWFGRTVIKSGQRYTYEQAQKIIEGGGGKYADEILRLHSWAREMRAARMKEGAIEFSTVEVKFKLDAAGKPLYVYQKVMKEANWLIEEFMLLANMHVARHLAALSKDGQSRPVVYRVHDLPDPEKLATLRDFAGRLGYKLRSVKPEQASQALNDLIKQVKDKPEEEVIKQMAIRAMSKAVYTVENIGHYGLSFEHYTHFTSPIRRYPDVMVHRQLMHYEKGGKALDKTAMEREAKHASAMEKRAADAERASIKYKQVEYMLDKIGQHFAGTISGLTRWGMYVELEDTRVEGMVPLPSMDDDTYRYDEKTNTIVGQRYGERYEFGDKVKIEVKGADLALKQLDFRIV